MKRIINLRKFSSVSNNVMNMNIKGNIGIVDINNPLSSVNVINESFSKDLFEILDKYDKKNLKSIIFRSTKKNNFIAGADINMLRENEDEDIQKILEDGHRVISRLSNINSIAVINGSCLGGGLELPLSKSLILKPMIILRKVKSLPLSKDAGVFLGPKNKFDLVISLRSNSSFSAMTLFKISEILYIGYAYETPSD